MPTPKCSSRTVSRTARLRLGVVIRQARIDPCAFLAYLLADPAAPPTRLPALHRDLQNHLSAEPRAMVELPRDHGKTTQICLRLLWELGRNPNLRIAMVCASEAVALDRARFLRQSIERNPKVREVFPHLAPGYPWSARAFTVNRTAGIIGPSVNSFGVQAASTGSRADLLVCDDIVDVKAAFSQVERNRVSEQFLNNLLNLLEPDGRFWGLSTPWHADDLNARLKRNGGFSLMKRAISPSLESIWPERWPTPSLAQRKSEIGAAAFARGYHLTPIAEEELVIRPEWVQHWTERPATFDQIILAVDPAVTPKPTSDASALVVLGLSENTIYCLSAMARKVTAPALMDWIAATDAQWQPETIVFESNGAFEAVKDLLIRHASYGPKITGVKQSKSKPARFAAFAVAVENGSFRPHLSHEELFNQMCAFPFAEEDDLLDAAATGTAHLLGRGRAPRIWVL